MTALSCDETGARVMRDRGKADMRAIHDALASALRVATPSKKIADYLAMLATISLDELVQQYSIAITDALDACGHHLFSAHRRTAETINAIGMMRFPDTWRAKCDEVL